MTEIPEEPEHSVEDPDEPSPFKVALGFFILPLLLVIGGIGVFLLFGVLAHDDVDPADYLPEINGRGINEPWQAAFHLSQQLQFNEELHGDEAFARQVVDALANADADDPRVNRFLAIALGRIGHPVAVPVLMEQLNHPDDEVRVNSLWALGVIGDDQAADAVAGQLQAEADGVRTMAAYVLGTLQSPQAAEALRVALNDPVPSVRWNAAVALGMIEDPAGLEVLERIIDRGYLAEVPGVAENEHSGIMLAALAALEKLGAPGLENLLTNLQDSDSDPRVREAARRVLAAARESSASDLALLHDDKL
jgi:HEAT repeat protein